VTRYLTLMQVAELLDLTEVELYAVVRVAGLPALRIGGRATWRVEAGRLARPLLMSQPLLGD
jgi:hypothetical protein